MKRNAIPGSFIAAAKGDFPAELIPANARVVNTFNGGIETGKAAIYRGKVAGV